MKNLLFTFLLISLTLFSCKKDEDDNNSSSGGGSTQSNFICTGDGSSSYFPLEVGYRWTRQVSSQNEVQDRVEVLSSFDNNGLTYYEVNTKRIAPVPPYGQQIDDTTELYRTASNGAIYVTTESGAEYQFLPANLQIGTEWDYPYNEFEEIGTRRISSTSHIYLHHSCDQPYTNCIAVELYGQLGNLVSTTYFAPGIGQVDYELLLFRNY